MGDKLRFKVRGKILMNKSVFKIVRLITLLCTILLVVSCGKELGEGETAADYRARLEKKGVKFMPGLFVRAAAKNDSVIVDMFLKAKMNVNATDASGNSALVLAVNKGLPEMVKRLIDAGADLNVKSSKNLTPLEDACALGKTDVVKAILPYIKKTDPELLSVQGALRWSARQGFLEIATILVNEKVALNGKSSEGWTPLIWACKSGHLDVVKLLVENGAEINIRDKDGYTALDWAKNENYTKVMAFLKRKGAKGYAKF
jgi:ankyrin repeat protein